MKKWGSGIILVVLLVFIAMGASRDSLATGNLQADWSGIYDIIIHTAEGLQVPAELNIRDMGNGQVEVSGVFQDFDVQQLGEYIEDTEGDGLQAHFDIDHFGLVRGTIDFTICRSQGSHIIAGQGSADSPVVGRMAATFEGRRRGAESAAPAPVPAPGAAPAAAAGASNHVVWAVGAAALVILAALIFARRRRCPRR